MAEPVILLPEEIYAFYAPSEAPENILNFGPFACNEFQPPIGPNKPEGVADLPPYPIRNGRQQPDQQSQQQQQQQPQHKQQGQQQQMHNKPFFQKGKGKQNQQQPPQKKIVTTVEISPDFVNKDLGTWAKPKPTANPPQTVTATSQPNPVNSTISTQPQSQPKPASTIGFNPQKTSAFNPQSTTASSTTTTTTSTTTKPSSFNPQPATKTTQSEPNTTTTNVNTNTTTTNNSNSNNNNNNAGANAAGAPVWGKPVQAKQKPKTQSFAQLLEKESTVKPVSIGGAAQRQPPQFHPENVQGTTAAAAPPPAVPNNEADFPSFSAIKPKKDTQWGQVKP